MGNRVTQKIYTCDLCGKTPKNGEHLWHMNSEVWCEECCEKEELKDSEPKVCEFGRETIDCEIYPKIGHECTLCYWYKKAQIFLTTD